MRTAAALVPVLDSDGDGLPDSWGMACFGNTWQYDGNSGPDGDGMNNWFYRVKAVRLDDH